MQQQSNNRKLTETNRRHDQIPKITFFYAAPIYEEKSMSFGNSSKEKIRIKSPGILEFTTKYHKTMDTIVKALDESKSEVRF